jgi:hypothetical protein
MASRQFAAPIAWIGGDLGMLIGANLINLAAAQSRCLSLFDRRGEEIFDGTVLTGAIAARLTNLVFNEDKQNVTKMLRFCHIGRQTPADAKCPIDSCGAESYSPVIVIGGGVARVAYGVAPQTETTR